jgi:KaiC/GvpD/RAD55 family RecA-like ATPase
MFVVCRNKKDNTLFITTRMAREVMLRAYKMIGEKPLSNVLKSCETYADADHFKKEQERIDKELDNLLNKQP